jgi:predicted site-specific integrase-resolvase
MENFKGGKEAAEILGVHQRTLHLWDSKGLIETIRTPGNKRLYNVDKFLIDKKCKENICSNLDNLDNEEKLNIAYVRVSSQNQKDDLERQKQLMIHKYPKHLIIEEIGSGLNLNKRGIKK